MIEKHPYLFAVLTATLVVFTLYLIARLAPGRIPGLGTPPKSATDTGALGVNVLAFPQLPGTVPSFVAQFAKAQVPPSTTLAPV